MSMGKISSCCSNTHDFHLFKTIYDANHLASDPVSFRACSRRPCRCLAMSGVSNSQADLFSCFSSQIRVTPFRFVEEGTSFLLLGVTALRGRWSLLSQAVAQHGSLWASLLFLSPHVRISFLLPGKSLISLSGLTG